MGVNKLNANKRWVSVGLCGVLAVLLLLACGGGPNPGPIGETPTPSSATPSQTAPLPLASPSGCAESCVSPTAIPFGPWGGFATPASPAPTAFPSPAARLGIPEDVSSVLLLGSARTSEFPGRTNSVTLIFFNSRTAKASLVSLPPLLYLYLPGLTMQRLNVAYPSGGVDLVQDTLAYNLGIRPSGWAVAHLDDFPALIDDLGGVDVTVLSKIDTKLCKFEPGDLHLDGERTLCYVRVLPGGDEIARLRRQQEVLRTLFLKLVNGGNLGRVPDLYQKYQGMLQTNFGVADLQNLIPLALKLGDQGRVTYYQVGESETIPWQIPQSPGSVLLPRRVALQALLQKAVDDVSIPAPLTDRVNTLVAELTTTPIPSETPIYTQTYTPSATSRPTATMTLTPTRTLTPTHTTTPWTATPTVTGTPPTETPTGSVTAESTETESSTATTFSE